MCILCSDISWIYKVDGIEWLLIYSKQPRGTTSKGRNLLTISRNHIKVWEKEANNWCHRKLLLKLSAFGHFRYHKNTQNLFKIAIRRQQSDLTISFQHPRGRISLFTTSIVAWYSNESYFLWIQLIVLGETYFFCCCFFSVLIDHPYSGFMPAFV